MGKKMKLLPALFKHKEAAREPWQWPSCKQPKTLSFRAGDDVFKTVNSMFFDPNPDETPAESWFTTSSSSESASFCTESDRLDHIFDGETLEMVVKGARSERLFFEPGGDTSSILENAKSGAGGFRFKDSVVFAMESADPYLDFKRSMEEMVQTHGLKDWDCLEELLAWYLKANGKTNHGFIISAFIDVLVGLSSTTSGSDNSSSTTYYSSAVSSFPSSPLSSTQGDVNNEIEEEENIVLP